MGQALQCDLILSPILEINQGAWFIFFYDLFVYVRNYNSHHHHSHYAPKRMPSCNTASPCDNFSTVLLRKLHVELLFVRSGADLVSPVIALEGNGCEWKLIFFLLKFTVHLSNRRGTFQLFSGVAVCLNCCDFSIILIVCYVFWICVNICESPRHSFTFNKASFLMSHVQLESLAHLVRASCFQKVLTRDLLVWVYECI